MSPRAYLPAASAPARPADFVVVGAGLMGALTCHYLLENNPDVTVRLADKDPSPAMGASGANACQLSWSNVRPFGNPGLLAALPAALTGRSTGVKIAPSALFSPACLRLAYHSLPGPSERASISLLELAEESRALMQTLREKRVAEPVGFPSGKLIIYESKKDTEIAAAYHALAAARGFRKRSLTSEEAFALAPGLDQNKTRFHSAVSSPDDEAGDAAWYCRDVIGRLTSQYGERFRFLPEHEAVSYSSERGEIQTRCGKTIAGGTFVFACGASPAPAGVKGAPAMVPVRGWTLDFDVPGTELLRHSLTLPSAKAVFVPAERRMLVSGMFYVGYARIHPSLHDKAVVALRQTACARFPDLNEASFRIRTGIRPCSPEGTPTVRPIGKREIFCGAAGMYGWTLSFSTAARAAKAAEALHGRA